MPGWPSPQLSMREDTEGADMLRSLWSVVDLGGGMLGNGYVVHRGKGPERLHGLHRDPSKREAKAGL